MLDEFITAQLEKLGLEKEDLIRQLQEIAGEEDSQNKKISELLDEEDVGIEIFSPRSANHTVKAQIEEIKKHIDELQYEAASIQDLLEKNSQQEEKYQALLLEIRQKNASDIKLLKEENPGHDNEEKKEMTDESSGAAATAFSDRDDKNQGPENGDQTGEKDALSSEMPETITNQEKAEGKGSNELFVTKPEMEQVLQRVEKCLHFAHSDKIKCRNELKNLRYYLKALLSRTDWP